MKKYNLKDFELSQSYLFFWDKLEKANWFLEQILDTVDEPLDGRLLQELCSDPVGDGGQWDMVSLWSLGSIFEPCAEHMPGRKPGRKVWTGAANCISRYLQCAEFAGNEPADNHQASGRCAGATQPSREV